MLHFSPGFYPPDVCFYPIQWSSRMRFLYKNNKNSLIQKQARYTVDITDR